MKILIVEDDAILAMVHQKYVETTNHEVIGCVATGEEAIQLTRQQKPDAILMDITIIGELDGIETMQEIRKFSDVPVIYVTGNSDPRAKERARQTGLTDFLIKPLDKHMLKYALDKIPG